MRIRRDEQLFGGAGGWMVELPGKYSVPYPMTDELMRDALPAAEYEALLQASRVERKTDGERSRAPDGGSNALSEANRMGST